MPSEESCSGNAEVSSSWTLVSQREKRTPEAAVSPDRVVVEVIDGVQVLIQVDVGGEGDVGVVSRLEVCHAAGGDAEAAQHWGQADRDRRGVNPQAGLIEEA